MKVVRKGTKTEDVGLRITVIQLYYEATEAPKAGEGKGLSPSELDDSPDDDLD